MGKISIYVLGLIVAIASVPARGVDHKKDKAQHELSAAFEMVQKDALATVPDSTIASRSAEWVSKMPELGDDPPELPQLASEAGLSAWFDQIWQRYHGHVSESRLVAEAVNGMIAATGEPGEYIDVAYLRRMLTAPSGTVGLSAKFENGIPTIVDLRKGGPAAQELAIGDHITAIDGVAAENLDLDELMLRLRGKPGSFVSLSYIRGDEPEKSASLKRDVIPIPQVDAHLDGNVTIVRIPRFDEDTAKQITEAVAAHGSNHAYVLDLRGNQGGLFRSVIETADLFLDKGEIGDQHGRTPKDLERYFARKGDVLKGAPLAVLVNGTTASGAEILAAALQTSARARIVGEPTPGNGLIQTLLLLDENSAIKLTTSQYFKSDQTPLEGHGITPDVNVTPNDNDGDAILERALALFR